MYRLTCDGLPLLDWRENDLVLVDPKVKLEVNTVGEGSFTIYKNHPNYGSLKKLKSVFEVADDQGVIFRGRATRDSVDFDHGMYVDMEGAMAYFNDSVVRPYNFPDDFLNNAEYIQAANSGNVIAFFLSWLINNHNSQVKDFQKMKLGRVTVADPNNYITRSNSGYASTWETLKGKLFDSSLGGYLCIRYEADGNYIDYLAEFTETNSQEIVFGENLLDLKNETEASGTYSAIIPLGAAAITIEGKPDGNITDDIVKSGDMLYSKKAVEEYGWIFAPTSETTWDDVTDDANLLKKGAEWLANDGVLVAKAIEAAAVDLHFTDEQVESLRIYKNVNVRSAPHGVSESFPLSRLEIELLNPQNTKITVGKTIDTLTERTSIQQEEAKKQYSKLSKTDEQILLLVQGVGDNYTKLAVLIDGVTVTDANGTTLIKGSSIDTNELYVNAANIRGVLAIGNLPDNVAQTGDIPTKVSQLNNDSGFQTLAGVTTIIGGTVTTDFINALGISVNAANITGTLTIGQLPGSVAETSDIPTNTSQLTNDSGYQNLSGVTQIIGGTVTTDFVEALGIHVDAAKINGTLEADQIKLTGAITWDDLDVGVQDDINDRGISAARAKTIINEELVSSPNIAGGKFLDLDQTTWLEMGTPTSNVAYLMQYSDLYSSGSDPVVVMGFSGTNSNPNWVLAPFFNIALNYLETNETMYAFGNWDFSNADVSGLDGVGGEGVTVTPVWG